MIRNLLDQCRQRVIARINRANQETERETLAAGDALNRIVEEARSHVQEVQNALGNLGQDSLAPLVQRQVELIARYRETVTNRIAEQSATAEQATSELKQIQRMLVAVRNVAVETRVLALNTRVKATRLGATGGTFCAIADEMARLSASVEETNRVVHQLAEGLLRTLPEIAAQASAVKESAETLSRDLAQHIGELRTASDEFKRGLAASLAAGDRRLSNVMRATQDALSHLQFQDPIAQQLLVCNSEVLQTADFIMGLLEQRKLATSDEGPVTPDLGHAPCHDALALKGLGSTEEAREVERGNLILF